jgi:hypothetical protein
VDVDLGWLVGRTLSDVERLGPRSWRFRFGPDAEVRSESPWRIIWGGGIALSNVDDGQHFGLPAPLDAEDECRALVGGAVVLSAAIGDETRDIVIRFDSGARLEVVPLSSGYESWQLTGPCRLQIIAMGGGELVMWGPDAAHRTSLADGPS